MKTQTLFIGGAILVVLGGLTYLGISSTGQDRVSLHDADAERERNEQARADEREESRKETLDILKATSGEADIDLTFAHTVPGKYSEVYGTAKNFPPGEIVKATLYKTITNQSGALERVAVASRSAEANKDGLALFTWEITEYGRYEAEITVVGSDGYSYTVKESVVVE